MRSSVFISSRSLVCSACIAFASFFAHAESTPDESIRSKVPGKDRTNARVERPTQTVELTPAKLNLQVGERLTYDIRVSGLPAGKAMLEVRKTEKYGEGGPDVWVIGLETRSNRAVSMFYDVRDKASAFIDVKGGFSRFYHMIEREGDVKGEEKIAFNYDIGNMLATYQRPRSDGQWRTHEIPLTGKVLDPLSSLYFLRSFAPGGTQPEEFQLNNLEVDDQKPARPGHAKAIILPICADRRVWMTRLRVVERRLNEDFGDLKGRECIAIEPEAEFKGLFERKGKMRVWVDVATGIPLKMTVEIPIGPAEVILSDHTNSPLTIENK
jgi:hypothetical protein